MKKRISRYIQSYRKLTEEEVVMFDKMDRDEPTTPHEPGAYHLYRVPARSTMVR